MHEPHTFQVGEQVAIQYGPAWNNRYTIATITSISAKGVITIEGSQETFSPSGECTKKRTKHDTAVCLVSITPEIRASIRRKRLLSLLSVLDYNDWEGMPLEMLEDVTHILQHFSQRRSRGERRYDTEGLYPLVEGVVCQSDIRHL